MQPTALDQTVNDPARRREIVFGVFANVARFSSDAYHSDDSAMIKRFLDKLRACRDRFLLIQI